jgi:recombination protein RecT
MTTRTAQLRDAIPEAPTSPAPNGAAKALAKPDPAGDLLASMEDEFKKCLPDVLPWDMFARVALTGFRKSPDLVDCTRPSLLGALMECARLGLAPCTEQATLTPFRNNKTGKREAQLIVGYEGYVQLMYRSGQVEQVVAELVYEADEWEYTLGDGGRFWHKPNITARKKDRGEAIFAYSYATLLSGGRTRIATVNREEAEELQQKHGGNPRGPWRTNFPQMWLKTPVRRVQRFAPKSPELRRALAVDGATFDLGGIVDTSAVDGDDIGVEVTETAPAADADQGWPEAAKPADADGAGR